MVAGWSGVVCHERGGVRLACFSAFSFFLFCFSFLGSVKVWVRTLVTAICGLVITWAGAGGGHGVYFVGAGTSKQAMSSSACGGVGNKECAR